MRAKPSNWFRSLQAVGFRRRARHSRPFAVRPLKVEDLESRILLTVDADLTASSTPIATSPTTVVFDSSSSPHFHIADAAAQQVFSVDTVNDPQNGLEAVLRMSPNAPANLQTNYEFDVVLSASNQDVATYHVQVVLPGAQMLRDLRAEHTQEAKAVVSAVANMRGLPVATLNADGDFIEGATVTSTSEDGLSVMAPWGNAAGGDTNSPATEDIAEATPISSPTGTITDVSTRLDLLAPFATAVAQDAATPISVQKRVNIYAGLANLASDIDTVGGGQASSTTDQHNAHRIGADLDLMAGQLKADMASNDPVLAAAAKQAYDAALEQSDLYFRLWSGQGINSEVYAQATGQNTQYSVFYETGYVQVTNQIAVDLGRSALVMVTMPQGLGMATGHASYFTPYTTSFGAAAATYFDVSSQSTTAYGGPTNLSVIVSRSGSAGTDGLLKFNLSGVTADQFGSASLKLDVTSISSSSVQVDMRPEPNTTWNESLTSQDVYGHSGDFGAAGTTPISFQAAAGSNNLDVTSAVQRAIRVGDTAFSDHQGSVSDEIESFDTLLYHPVQYLATYGYRATLTSPSPSDDILYRADANFDGQVTSADGAVLLAMHGVAAGDVNLDGIANGQDIALVTSNWLQAGSYEQGDANFDNIINGQDLTLVASNWLATGSLHAVTPALTLRLSTNSTGSVTFASENDPTLSNRPQLNVTQTPDVAIHGFFAELDPSTGQRELAVKYSIGQQQNQPTDPVGTFRIGIYRSSPNIAGPLFLITSFQVSNASDRTAGDHTVFIPAASQFDSDVLGNDDLWAEIDDEHALGEVNADNSMVFQGGVFVSAHGSLQVQGPDRALVGLSNSVTLTPAGVTLNQVTYAMSVDGNVYVHTHGLNDSITVTPPASGVTYALYGGAGSNNTLNVATTASNVGISGSAITNGSAALNYSHVQGLHVTTTGATDTTVTVSALSGVSLSVNADSHTPTTLSINATTSVVVDYTTISVAGWGKITYASAATSSTTLKALAFDGGNHGGSLLIDGYQGDAFTWNSASNGYAFNWVDWLSLSAAGFAQVTLDTVGGSLGIDRHLISTSHAFDFSGTTATVDGLALTYLEFATVALLGGSGTDTLSVTDNVAVLPIANSSGQLQVDNLPLMSLTSVENLSIIDRYSATTTNTGAAVTIGSLPNGLRGLAVTTDGGNDNITVNSLVTGLQSLTISSATGSDNVTIAGSALPGSLSTLSVTAQGNATFTLPALIPASAAVTVSGGLGSDTLKLTDSVPNVAISNSAGQLKVDNLPAITLNSIENLQVTDGYSGTGASMTVASLPNGLQNMTLNGSSVSGTTFTLSSTLSNSLTIAVNGVSGSPNDKLIVSSNSPSFSVGVNFNNQLQIDNLPTLALTSIENLQITNAATSGSAAISVQSLPAALQGLTLIGSSAGGTTFVLPNAITSLQAVTVAGATGGNNILQLTTAAQAPVITVDSNQKLKVGSLPAISLNAIPNIQITNSFSSGANVDVQALPAGVQSFSLFTDVGSDSVTIEAAALPNSLSQLSLSDTAGTNTFLDNAPLTSSLSLSFTCGSTGSNALSLTTNLSSAPISRDTSGKLLIDGLSPITLSNIQTLQVTDAFNNGGNGATVTVNSVPSSVQSLTITTDGGNDAFIVNEPATGSLPTLTLNAGSGTDSVTINDLARATSQSVTVGSSTIAVSGTTADPPINYSGVESLNVNTDGGGDTISITALPSSLHNLAFQTDGGDDQFLLANLPSGLNVSIDGGAGSNTLSISTGSTGDTFSVSNSQVQVNLATVTYSNIQNLVLDADGNSAGQDSLTVTGAAGADQFTMSGKGSGGGTAPFTVAWNQGPTISGKNFERVTLAADSGNSLITVTGTLPGVAVTLQGGSADDTFVDQQLAAGSLSIDGGSGTNFVDLSNSSLNNLSALPNLNNIQTLDLSHNNFTSAPALTGNLSATLTTLDLKYNAIDLSVAGTLAALSTQNSVRQLYLFGNKTAADGSTNLADLADTYLRVDLAPVRLDQAEAQAIANLQMHTTHPLQPIAQALHYLPLEIYDYVANNYAFQLYGGQVKGDQGVIATHAGNDVDQTIFLQDLLKEIGVVSTLQTVTNSGGASGLLVPVVDMEKWLGVQNLDAVKQLFSNAGVVYTPVTSVSGGPTTGIAISHTWLGFIGGASNLVFDPSWKVLNSSSNIATYLANLPGNFHSVGQIVAETQNASFVPTDAYNPFTSLSFYTAASSTNEVAYEWFQDQTSKWLVQNAPGYTLADLSYNTTIQPIMTVNGQIPIAPRGVLGGVLSTVYEPGDQQEYVRFILKGSDNSGPQQLDLAVPAIDMEEISVRWEGTNNLTATLYVGEEPKLSRTYSSNDHTFNFEFGFIAPGSNRASPNLTLDRDTVYSRPVGKVIAVGINAGQITPALVAREQALVTSDSLPVLQNHSTISSFGDRQIAHVLALAMTQYFALVDEGQKVADGLFQTIQDRGHISAGIVSADSNLSILGQSITALSSANIHDDSQIPIVPNGLFVDVPRNTYSATSVAGDLDDAKQREYLISASSSSQESDIFEQLLSTSTISTVRSFQLANQSAVSIFSFTYSIGQANDAQTWANYVANELRNSGGDLTYDSSGQTGQINKLTQVLAAEPVDSTVHLYLPVKQTKVTGSGSSTLWQGYTYFLAVDRPDGSYTNLWFIDGSTGSSGGGGQPYGYEIDEEDLVPLLPQRSAKVGDPMNVANGAAYEDVQDISISNIGLPLNFSRHYDSSVVSNSVSTNDPTAAGDPMLGRGWFGTYSDHLYVDGSGNAHWRNNQGQLYTFNYSAGTYSTPLGLTGEFRKVTASDYGGSYVGDYLFRDSTGVSRVLHPGSGHLDAISNLDGDLLRLQWTSTGFSVFDENTTRVLYFNYNSASDTTLKNVTLGGASSNQWLYGVSNGYLTSVTDPGATSPTYAYAYFGVNNATANNSADGTVGTPIAQRLAEVVLPDGGEIKYSYYANGRVFQVTNPDQSVQTIEYDAFANNATFVDERGSRTDYFYNSSGFQTKVLYPDGSIETKIWGDGSTTHPVDKPEYSTDVYGLTTFNTYYPDSDFSHAGGRFGAVQRSDLGTLSWSSETPTFTFLNGTTNTASLGTTPVALTTTYTYATGANTVAALNQPQSTIAPATFKFLLPQTTVQPSDSSQPHKTGLVYDQYGNVVEQLQYIDANTTIETDIFYYPTTSNEWYAGLVSERKVLTNGTVNSDTTYEHYDTPSSNGKARNAQAGEIDRWVSDVLVFHNWIHEYYSYDFETGAVISSINANSPSSADAANNYTTSYVVDAFGRVTDTKLPVVLDAISGNSVRPNPKTSYNQDGTVKDTTDADGRVTKYTYDTMQRVIKTEIDTPTGVVASIVANTYDAAGNKISQTDADGHVTRFVYDNRNRPIETIFAVTVAEQLASGTGHLPASTTSYNGRGQPVISTDALGNQTINTYDQFGRVASVQLPDPDGTAPQLHAPLTKYTYDAAGNRLSMTVTTVAAGASTAATQYAYDGLNRLVQQIDPAPGGTGDGHAPIWSYTYDALGNVLTKKLVDATAAAITVQLTTNTYDGVGHLWKVTEQNGTNPSVWIYGYDNVGNRITSTDPNRIETDYKYDNLNRLKEQDNLDASQWNYQYDLVGNVHTATLTGQTYNAAGSHHTATLSQTKTFYDALNRPLTTTSYDVGGATLATTKTVYDVAGNILSTTDGLGNLTRFTYDARNRRISVIDPLGNETTTAYDANGNITSVTDPLGNLPTSQGDTWFPGGREDTTHYTYDALNRLLTTRSPTLRTSLHSQPTVTTNVYDDRGDIVTAYAGIILLQHDRKTDYKYDNLHRRTQELEPADAEPLPKRQEIDYTYDVAGNVLTKSLGTQDAPGQYVTQYKYDALGRLLKEQDPDPDGTGSAHSSTTYYGHDLNGNVTAVQTIDPVNNATLSYVTYSYDTMNRRNHTSTFDVQAVAAPQSGDNPTTIPQGTSPYTTTSTQYDGAGHAQLVQDALLRGTFTDYDGLGRVIDQSELDHNGAYLTQTLLTYDADGNRLSSTVVAVGASEPNRTTTYAYDADGHQIRSTDPLGHMTSHTYDVNGNVHTTTDALGNTTSYTYDELNRVMTMTVPTGSDTSATTKFNYDGFGNIRDIENPDGTHINRRFDAYDHVTQEDEVVAGPTILGQSQTYIYDWLGHLQSETDHNGQTVNYSYDLYGHKLSESWTWPGGQVEVLSYQYTTDGKLASADDKLGTVQQSHYDYAYDQEPLRRLRFESFIQPTVTSTQVATWYTYDKDSELLTRLTNPFGSNAAYQTAYTYDDAGREQTAAEQTAYGGSTFAQGTFGWDYANSLRTIARSAGGQTVPATTVTTDIAGRITQIQADGLQLNYSYDADNRVVSETDVNPVNSAVTGANAYTYDAASQVLTATHSAGGPANETYAYDANGNRMVTPSTGQQAYDAWHRLQNDGVYSYTYDANGNLTKQIQLATGQVTTYTWDPLNRLIQIEVYPNSTSQTELAHVEYRYDPFGNRILRTNITNYGATVSSTSYVYASVAATGGSTSDPILSRSATGANSGQVTHRYLYGPGPGSTDQLLADNTLVVATGSTNATGIRWALDDQQGTTRRLINSAGADVADFNYDSFGNLASTSTKPEAVDFLFGFEGGEYDGETAAYNGGTGLVRFDARYYNPRTGQFLSTDPAGADTNPYRYSGNDPVNSSDPSGLMTRSIYGSLGTSSLLGGSSGWRGLIDAALSEDEEFDIGSFYSGLGSSRGSTSGYTGGSFAGRSTTYDLGSSWGGGSNYVPYTSSSTSSLLKSLSPSSTSTLFSSLGGGARSSTELDLGSFTSTLSTSRQSNPSALSFMSPLAEPSVAEMNGGIKQQYASISNWDKLENSLDSLKGSSNLLVSYAGYALDSFAGRIATGSVQALFPASESSQVTEFNNGVTIRDVSAGPSSGALGNQYLAVSGTIAIGGVSARSNAPSNIGVTPAQSIQSPLWTSTANRSSVENAFSHFQAHGADFGATNAMDYVGKTQRFLNNPPPFTQSALRANGDIMRYNSVTETFGVMDASGAPRTMFKPLDGPAYWQRQVNQPGVSFNP